MIDSHCHLNFNAFKNDWREVLKRSFEHGVTAMINIGSNYKTSERAVNIAKEYNQCFAAVGLHPIHACPVRNNFLDKKGDNNCGNQKKSAILNKVNISNGVNDEEFDQQKFHSLIRANKRMIKAIGETGLDYFHQPADTKLQKEVFLKHLDLAKESNLPVILHCRGDNSNPLEAYKDLLNIIQNQLILSQAISQTNAERTQNYADDQRQSASSQRKSAFNGVLHCFSANWQIAQKFLDLGFYIGFTGIITFDNCGQDLLEVVAKTPLEKILIETDAPYLAPEPYRGQRCEPWYVKFTAQKIAAIKKITLEEVIQQTTKNAKELFKI